MIMKAHGDVFKKSPFAIIQFYTSMNKIYVQTRLNGKISKRRDNGVFVVSSSVWVQQSATT
jgi:hypothetical protein